MKRFVLLSAVVFSCCNLIAQSNGSLTAAAKKGKTVSKKMLLSASDTAWLSQFNMAIAQQLQSTNLSDTLFINFKQGVYSIKSPLVFKGKIGQATPPIIINGGKGVIFSGGITLNSKNFQSNTDPLLAARILNQEAAKKVLVYDLAKEGINNLGQINCIGFGRKASIAPAQLFCNGQRMTLARYPNDTNRDSLKKRTAVLPIKTIVNPGLQAIELPLEDSEKKGLDQKGEFKYTDAHVSKWSNAKDVWVDGIFSRDWAWSLNKINAIDTEAHTIQLTYPEKYDLTNKNAFFFATNLLEEIDIPGEYYIDREQGKLYFYPPQDFNRTTASIQLSSTEKDLISIEACGNISFNNITFELGRFRAVSVDKSHHIAFEHCSFKNFGASALSIKGQNNTVNHCNIQSIGGTAITLDGGNLDSLTKSNNTVSHCDIADWAYYNRVYTPAIALLGVGHTVTNNFLHNAPHGAITISGNDHLIEKNEIAKVLLEFRDFGAIYAFLGKNPLMRGHLIKGNYFHDIGQIGEGVHAIYADEGTAGWTITDNVFYKIGHQGARVASVLGNTSSYVKVQHNLFIDCAETFEVSFHFSTWGKKRYSDYFMKSWKKQFATPQSISALYLAQYPELSNYMQEERVYVTTNSFTNNTIGNFAFPLNHSNVFRTQSNLPNADSLIVASNNVITKDQTLPNFLQQWGNKKTNQPLPLSMPKPLQQYGFFNTNTSSRNASKIL